MKINRPKTSNYNDVNDIAIINDMETYSQAIWDYVGRMKNRECTMGRSGLKRIAVDLEDAVKVLEYCMEGRY